jgi:hypothetical protein
VSRCRGFVRRLAGGTVAAALAGLLFAGVQQARVSAASSNGTGPQVPAQAQKPPAKKDPAARAEEPWPDAQRLAARRVDAENLPLFGSADPLAFTLTADFGAINRDRDPKSTRRYPGVLQFPGEGGGAQSVPVQLSARGHARRNRSVCAVVPLRLEFAKADLKSTVLGGQRELKLVTHCDNDDDHEQYVLTEYLAYRLFGLFTPLSFRTRLAMVTYVDPNRNRTPAARYGILLENDEDLARRMEGRLYPIPNRLFRFLDRDSVVSMTLLQFMIGNTDYSIMALHNVKLVRNQGGVTYPIGYDFDYSGLVDAPYAVVDRRFMIKSVRDRLYRGPCLTASELEPLRARIAAKKGEALALIDAVPGLKSTRRASAREYLDEFFSLMASPSRAKRELIDSCRPAAGM